MWQYTNNMQKKFHKFVIAGQKMRALAKSAKTHPAAKKCCGWEEPAICDILFHSFGVTFFYGEFPEKFNCFLYN